jgi:hypothetical protein
MRNRATGQRITRAPLSAIIQHQALRAAFHRAERDQGPEPLATVMTGKWTLKMRGHARPHWSCREKATRAWQDACNSRPAIRQTKAAARRAIHSAVGETYVTVRN